MNSTILLLVLLVIISTVSAFVPSTPSFDVKSSTTTLFEGKINEKIDLDSPKVATMETVKPGDKKVYCRCWLSGTFPLCDASHVPHNKETGDNVGPLIVTAEKSE